MLIRGAVAQMEERLICIQQVIGSNPFGSTVMCMNMREIYS